MTIIGKFEIETIQESDPQSLMLAASALIDGRRKFVGEARIELNVSPNYDGLCYCLERMYVGLPVKPGSEPELIKETRGLGIGRALHNQVINWARDRGCGIVVADVVPYQKGTEDEIISALLRWGYILEYMVGSVPRYRLDLNSK